MRVNRVKETAKTVHYDVEDKGKTFRVVYVPETSTGKQHWVTCNCPVWLAGIGMLPKHEKKPKREITKSFHLVCSHGWRVLQCRQVINVNGKPVEDRAALEAAFEKGYNEAHRDFAEEEAGM